MPTEGSNDSNTAHTNVLFMSPALSSSVTVRFVVKWPVSTPERETPPRSGCSPGQPEPTWEPLRLESMRRLVAEELNVEEEQTERERQENRRGFRKTSKPLE